MRGEGREGEGRRGEKGEGRGGRGEGGSRYHWVLPRSSAHILPVTSPLRGELKLIMFKPTPKTYRQRLSPYDLPPHKVRIQTHNM